LPGYKGLTRPLSFGPIFFQREQFVPIVLLRSVLSLLKVELAISIRLTGLHFPAAQICLLTGSEPLYKRRQQYVVSGGIRVARQIPILSLVVLNRHVQNSRFGK